MLTQFSGRSRGLAAAMWTEERPGPSGPRGVNVHSSVAAIMISFTTHKTDNGTLVVRLGGDLDAESNEYFFDCIEGEIEDGNNQIVINCAELGYISSVGFGALIRARSRVARTDGRICFARINATILKMLRLVKLDTLFDVFPTEREAIAHIEG
jgi:anti-sigma B factor antagonist